MNLISRMTGINANALNYRARELGFAKHEKIKSDSKQTQNYKSIFGFNYSLDDGNGNFDINKFKLVAI